MLLSYYEDTEYYSSSRNTHRKEKNYLKFKLMLDKESFDRKTTPKETRGFVKRNCLNPSTHEQQ